MNKHFLSLCCVPGPGHELLHRLVSHHSDCMRMGRGGGGVIPMQGASRLRLEDIH